MKKDSYVPARKGGSGNYLDLTTSTLYPLPAHEGRECRLYLAIHFAAKPSSPAPATEGPGRAIQEESTEQKTLTHQNNGADEEDDP